MSGKRLNTWQPGESGNPRGRPPGKGKFAELRTAIGEHLPLIVENLVEAARGGDVQAARILLDRALPALKPIEMQLPVALPGNTLAEQGRSVLQALENGAVAPSQAVAMIGAIGQLARVVEIVELEARIRALEVRREQGSSNT